MNALTRDLVKLVETAEQSQKTREELSVSDRKFREKLHLMPPVGWLNDPNGLCQFQGIYHAFFQYSPFDVEGGVKMWGHYTSTNMIDWEYQGTALYPDQPFDCHGVYSGSAFIEDGKMYLYYTGNVKLEDGEYDYIRTGREGNTVLVITEDGKTFGKKKELMRNSDYPDDLTCHVRDPKVWKENDIYYMVQARDKYLALKRIADFYPNIYGIVFCRTRKETQEIADKLIQDGYNADSLHGELSQAQRDYVMQKFRVKNIQLLVATDVAARGLDVDDLTHVINYGLPDEVESYTHRRGRTGRAGKTGISISICHVKEKGKIREIERIINKKFEKGEMPTGHAICEKQLFNLVDQIEKVKVNEEEIASLMPQIYRKLEWLDKEDIIKRVVSLEFNRMIDYYKDADEIQQVDERSSRSERGERRAHAAEEGYSRFFLNFGKADGLYPNQLIELVNKCVPGKVRIGKIDLRENFSFFEVEEGEAQRVMDSMNGFEVDGRRISVEPAQGKKEEGGRGGKRSYGGRRSDDGYKGKRGSKDSGRRGGDRSDRTFRKDERDSDRPWKRTAAARDALKKRRF